MPGRQRRLGAAAAVVLLAATPLAACASDDSGGGDGQAADEPAATSSTTETTTTTSAPDVPGEDVAFTSADGVELAGRIYGDGATAIVASHESGRSKGDFAPSPRLVVAGFTVLTYDNRGDGASGPGDPAQRIQDLIAAVDLARTRGATKVFLLGASRGGALSLTGATQIPVAGLITISAPSPAEDPASVAAMTVPSLYVNRENDGYADSTQAMYAAANEPKRLHLPGRRPGVALFARHADLIDLVTNFIREHGGA
jgi:pimeloyl-ACP methyl ester carboxylesterase